MLFYNTARKDGWAVFKRLSTVHNTREHGP